MVDDTIPGDAHTDTYHKLNDKVTKSQRKSNRLLSPTCCVCSCAQLCLFICAAICLVTVAFSIGFITSWFISASVTRTISTRSQPWTRAESSQQSTISNTFAQTDDYSIALILKPGKPKQDHGEAKSYDHPEIIGWEASFGADHKYKISEMVDTPTEDQLHSTSINLGNHQVKYKVKKQGDKNQITILPLAVAPNADDHHPGNRSPTIVESSLGGRAIVQPSSKGLSVFLTEGIHANAGGIRPHLGSYFALTSEAAISLKSMKHHSTEHSGPHPRRSMTADTRDNTYDRIKKCFEDHGEESFQRIVSSLQSHDVDEDTDLGSYLYESLGAGTNGPRPILDCIKMQRGPSY